MYIDHTTPLLAHCENSLNALSPRNLQTNVRKYQHNVNIWADHRKNIISALKKDCAQLDGYRTNSLLSRVAGSSIGFASSGAMIVGYFYSSQLLLAALIVSGATGLSNSVALFIKWKNQTNKMIKFQKYVETDRKLLQEVIKSHVKVSNMIKKPVESETLFRKNLRAEQDFSRSICNFVVNEKPGSAIAMTVLAYELKFLLGFGVIIDFVTLIKCFKGLKRNSKPVQDIRDIVGNLENGLEAILVTDGESVVNPACENDEINKIQVVDGENCRN